MKRLETMAPEEMVLRAVSEEPIPYDRHEYLRPWRYFRFYMLYEPHEKKTCWLPEGYGT